MSALDNLKLAELKQMSCAPSDNYSAGAWCEALNEALALIAEFEERERKVERLIVAADAGASFAEWAVDSVVRSDSQHARAEDVAAALREAVAALRAEQGSGR